jgi:hypothetical protein
VARADNFNWVLNPLPAWFVGYALLARRVRFAAPRAVVRGGAEGSAGGDGVRLQELINNNF